MEEPGRLQSMGSLKVGHGWATSRSCIEEGNGNLLQYSCLENPSDRGAWWAAIYGVAQSQTQLKRQQQQQRYHFNHLFLYSGFSGFSDRKESTCNVGDLGSISGLGRSPGEGNSNTLKYSGLENSMDKRAWWATLHGVTKSQTKGKGIEMKQMQAIRVKGSQEKFKNLLNSHV